MPLSACRFGGIMTKWVIKQSEEFQDWFDDSDEDLQDDILEKVKILEELGPNLGRPLVDTLKGSTIKNLKELRFDSMNKVIRITFVFDPDRNGILLIGGNKAGSGDKGFYKKLIDQSEKIYARWLEKRKGRSK